MGELLRFVYINYTITFLGALLLNTLNTFGFYQFYISIWFFGVLYFLLGHSFIFGVFWFSPYGVSIWYWSFHFLYSSGSSLVSYSSVYWFILYFFFLRSWFFSTISLYILLFTLVCFLCLGIFIACFYPTWVISVSYTHLDVYKRQVQASS